jgi:hypothetical protein
MKKTIFYKAIPEGGKLPITSRLIVDAETDADDFNAEDIVKDHLKKSYDDRLVLCEISYVLDFDYIEERLKYMKEFKAYLEKLKYEPSQFGLDDFFMGNVFDIRLDKELNMKIYLGQEDEELNKNLKEVKKKRKVIMERKHYVVSRLNNINFHLGICNSEMLKIKTNRDKIKSILARCEDGKTCNK